eukprot:scaffold29230_cov55-Phaeocystis_antarctica.AAC.6
MAPPPGTLGSWGVPPPQRLRAFVAHRSEAEQNHAPAACDREKLRTPRPAKPIPWTMTSVGSHGV